MEFKSTFFAIVLIGMFVTAISSWLVVWDDKYNGNTNFNELNFQEFDRTSEVKVIAEAQKAGFSPDDPDANQLHEDSILRSVFGTIIALPESFAVVQGMFTSISTRFGIPTWVFNGIITMIVLAITFSIIAVVFKLPRRSA